MIRLLLLSPLLAACNPPTPALPHELPYAARTFAVANTSTIIVTEFDPLAADNVEFEGSEVPSPQDEAGNPILTVPAAADVAVGRKHACVVTPTGSVHCWGDQTDAALGEHRVCAPPQVEGGTPSCILDAAVMPSLPPVRELAAGDDVTCAITMDDRVVCWGVPSRVGGSRLPALDPPTPVLLPDGQPLAATRVIINHGTVCAIDRTQALWCWGDRFGSSPQLQPQAGVVDVAFGRLHSCIIDADGLRCSGDNRNGQAGDLAHARACGNGPCTLGETSIALDATRVVVGERHTCVLARDGLVTCFGSNEAGQLGRTDAFLVGGPAVVLDGATDLASGYAHVCAQRNDNSVWCWGTTDITEVSP